MKLKTFIRVFVSAVVCILICSALYIKLYKPVDISVTTIKKALIHYGSNKSTADYSSTVLAQTKAAESTANYFPDSSARNDSTKILLNKLWVINNFGKNPETERNFIWFTSSFMKTGAIEYCTKNEFKGFDKNNIVRVQAKSYETRTDLDTRMVHKVELNNLKPGTEYVYRVEVGPYYVSSQGTFKTARQNLKNFTFINITDTQGNSAEDFSMWKNTLDKALEKFPDTGFLLHTGDMVDSGQKIKQWDLFTSAVKEELMNLPIAPTVGNHETVDRNHTNPNVKNFTDLFDLPKEENTGAPAGTVYSFDYGNAHIAVMNTECGSENLKKQADWLRNDMVKTDKLWKIVALHRGPYAAGTHNTIDIRDAWAPVFDEVGVDLVLQGHDHKYVRSYPVKHKAKVAKGTIYLDSNSGGVKFYPGMSCWWQAVDLQPKMQMYIAVTINNNKMKIHAYDVKNTLRDSVTLEK